MTVKSRLEHDMRRIYDMVYVCDSDSMYLAVFASRNVLQSRKPLPRLTQTRINFVHQK